MQVALEMLTVCAGRQINLYAMRISVIRASSDSPLVGIAMNNPTAKALSIVR